LNGHKKKCAELVAAFREHARQEALIRQRENQRQAEARDLASSVADMLQQIGGLKFDD
jgi:hypothetical protein